MKKTFALFIFILFSTAFNASAENIGIAVVDMQKILQDSSAAIDIREQIKIQRDQYQAEITEEEDKLRKAEKLLAEQNAILSPESFQQKREEFKEKLIQIQRDVQAKLSSLDSSLYDSLGQIQKVVFDIIGELSHENQFQLAVPNSQILYADKKLNITDEVIKRLDKRLPSISKTENTN